MHERSLLWRYMQAVVRIFTTLMFDVKIYGRHNVPRSGGVLLVSNHQSYLDPMLVAVQLYRPVSYMAKSELFVNPVFGWLIRSLHAFPIRQGDGDVGAVRETIRRLNEGHILSIFPEGTRTETGEMQPLEKGVALVIRKSNALVVPVAIDGSFAAWPKGSKCFHAHPVRVRYGEPMDMRGMKGDQIVRVLEEKLHALVAELRAGDPARSRLAQNESPR